MLKQRILSTLQFFDLQNYPLTLLELQKYLLADTGQIKGGMDENWDLFLNYSAQLPAVVSLSELLACLNNDCAGSVECFNGLYFLQGRKVIAQSRLNNYFYGIRREKLVFRYAKFLKYLPFVRAVALAGSQSLGQQTESSDIDLFVITDPNFLWLARIFVTGFLQAVGHRRHGQKVKDRFCLNHYLAGPQELKSHRDLYNAMEYLRFRPLFGEKYIADFFKSNLPWLKQYFPNFNVSGLGLQTQPAVQRWAEKIFQNKFGLWLNEKLGVWQLWRIKRGEYVLAGPKELAFYSLSRKRALLSGFFKNQEQQNREAVQAVS